MYKPPSMMDKALIAWLPGALAAIFIALAAFSFAFEQWFRAGVFMFTFAIIFVVFMHGNNVIQTMERLARRPFFVGPYSRQLGEDHRGSGWYFWEGGKLHGPYDTRGQAGMYKQHLRGL